MRRIREALRLHLHAGLSYNEVGRALKISKSSVGNYVSLARVAAVDWALAQTLTDPELQARLYRPALPRSSYQLTPDFAGIHQELKRPGVTLQLLWEEYAAALIGQGGQAYKYTSFCVKYRAWALGLKRSMRQTHLAGEKLFVDYAGQTVPIVDAATGEITAAQIFVATLGASNYTYACATRRQTTADWVGAQILALEFFGGVPRLIVPDQTRSLIKHPDRYDPEPNALYDEFASHYGCALLAARPAHPRDKPKVENAVLVVERWILARLRNRRFFSLAELNKAIAELLEDLNQRPFKKLPGCRRSAFEALDAPALRPLPLERFELFSWKAAKVNIDYHVEFEGHYYSVPHRAGGPDGRIARHGQAGGGLPGQPARGQPCTQLGARATHDRGRAHARAAPRAPGVDAPEADRLGQAHRRGYGRGRDLAAGTPPAPRARLSSLPGVAAPGPRVHAGAAGGGVHPGDGHTFANLPQRGVDPEDRAGPPAGRVAKCHCGIACARERARA